MLGSFMKRVRGFCLRVIFAILIIHKPSLMGFKDGLGPDRFSRFDVYWIQTNKQIDTQTSKVYIEIIT